MTGMTRRDFLKISIQGLLAVSSVLGLGMLARFLGHKSAPDEQTEFDLGPASSYPLGTRELFADIPALLVHTEAGFSALSLTCTHLGCTLEQTASGFACPCHNSRFDADGQVLQGPAAKTLVRLRVEQDGQGHLILSTAGE